jgi:P27 family predicted phage terminase small subunit
MGAPRGGARSGPPPTPTRLRLLHGAQKSKLNQHEPVPRVGELEPPDGMTADVLAIWEYTVRELVAMGIDAPADRDSLAAYCEAVDKHRKSSALLARSPLLVQGQKGNLVRNPLLIVQRDAALMIRGFAQEFGLTPSARTRIDSEKQQSSGDADNPFAI